jgi:hypothetical protein
MSCIIPLAKFLSHSYFIGRRFEEVNVDRTLLTTSSMSSSRICLAAGAVQLECIWRVAGLMEEHKSIWSMHFKLKIISKIKELGTNMF